MKTRTKWVIALAVAVGGLWLLGVFYVLSYKPETYINPGITTVSAPNPATVTMQSNRTASRVTNYPLHLSSYSHLYTRSSGSVLPTQPMRGLYTTSSAQVHSVGGGGNGSFQIATTSNSSSSRGIVYSATNVSVTMPSTTFVAMASQRQMAQPESAEAPQMARLAASPRTAPGPPGPPGPVDPEHQLIEQPIGDGMIVLLLLIMGYSLFLLRKRKEA